MCVRGAGGGKQNLDNTGHTAIQPAIDRARRGFAMG